MSQHDENYAANQHLQQIQSLLEGQQRAGAYAPMLLKQQQSEVQIEKILDSRVENMRKERAILIAYARIKLDSGDYHGVADAAMDLREIDAKLSVLKG